MVDVGLSEIAVKKRITQMGDVPFGLDRSGPSTGHLKLNGTLRYVRA
jgi:hypothetical protein